MLPARRRAATPVASRGTSNPLAHRPTALQIHQVGIYRLTVIPELGPHGGWIEENRCGTRVQQRHLDPGISSPDFQPSFHTADAAGATGLARQGKRWRITALDPIDFFKK